MEGSDLKPENIFTEFLFYLMFFKFFHFVFRPVFN